MKDDIDIERTFLQLDVIANSINRRIFQYINSHYTSFISLSAYLSFRKAFIETLKGK